MPIASYRLLRRCQYCGHEFLAKSIDSFYCSRACSKAAWSQRKRLEQQDKARQKFAESIPNSRTWLSVKEAVAIYEISRDTLYRLVRKDAISFRRSSLNTIRISKIALAKLFPKRKPLRVAPPSIHLPHKDIFNLSPEKCYTIGQVTEIFHIAEKSVYEHIRRFDIPMRQVGKFVYVPKEQVDYLYNHLST